MARVNRTTGFFLVIGVVALVATISGARMIIDPGEEPVTTDTPAKNERSVFASGNVDSASGLSVLIPSRPGRITAVNVREGDAVKAGQVLVQLDDQPERDALAIAEQNLVVARAALEKARDQIKEYELKVISQRNMVDQAQSRVQLAVSVAKQVERLRSVEASAEAKIEQAEIAVESARKDLTAAVEALRKLESIDPKKALREPEEAIKKAELEVKAARAVLDLYCIKAPADGTILEVNYQVGGSAPLPPADGNASRALVFLPNDSLIVRAEIDQENALAIKPGMKVTLTFRAASRDYKWTGSVEKVAGYITRRRQRVMDPDAFNDSRTRECIIRVDADPKNPDLIPGTRMGVQVHLEKQ